MNPDKIPVDPNDPEGSLQRHLETAKYHIEFFRKDSGHILALTYRGDDPRILKKMDEDRAYGMISPAKGEKPVLATMDTFLNEDGPADNLQYMKDAGFELTGYVENRYVDLFGLVEPDTAIKIIQTENGPARALIQRVQGNLTYITPEEAEEAKVRWYSEVQPSVEECKRPFIEVWQRFKENVEKHLERDFSALKNQVRWENQSDQKHPDLN